ncbi:hypothetical protein HYX10_00840 [Candidatus Woesearchaeota archaeon]|nr:hypothetical protein [Candidatus Woesearchaeota archaeon]
MEHDPLERAAELMESAMSTDNPAKKAAFALQAALLYGRVLNRRRDAGHFGGNEMLNAFGRAAYELAERSKCEAIEKELEEFEGSPTLTAGNIDKIVLDVHLHNLIRQKDGIAAKIQEAGMKLNTYGEYFGLQIAPSKTSPLTRQLDELFCHYSNLVTQAVTVYAQLLEILPRSPFKDNIIYEIKGHVAKCIELRNQIRLRDHPGDSEIIQSHPFLN